MVKVLPPVTPMNCSGTPASAHRASRALRCAGDTATSARAVVSSKDGARAALPRGAGRRNLPKRVDVFEMERESICIGNAGRDLLEGWKCATCRAARRVCEGC